MLSRFGSFNAKAWLVSILCLFSSFAYAGAWTQEVGKTLFIGNLSYYSTDRYFDNSGSKQPLASYKKYEFNPYIEYGFKDDITIGANLFVQRAAQYNNINIGIGDSEFFARLRLWQKDGLVFSLEPMIKLPSLEKESNQPQIGSRNFDTGLSSSIGYGFKAYNLNHYINMDTGYRHRFGVPSDQLKLSVSAGVSITKETMILTQLFATKRVASNYNPVFTQSSSDDYDLSKIQLSGVYKLNEETSLQLGAFRNVSGRNIGNGSGFIFSVSKIL